MLDLSSYILIGIIAIGIGFLASLFGIGGGFLLYPTMIFIAGMDVHSTVGTIPFVIVFMAFSSTLAYAKQKRIDYKITLLLVGASILGAVIGAFISIQTPSQILVILFGIVELILAIILGVTKNPEQIYTDKKILKNSIIIEEIIDHKKDNKVLDKKKKKWYLIYKHKIDASGIEFNYKANIILSLPISFLAGFLSSLLGIGGGSLYIQIFVFLCGMSIHMAIACSIFSIFISTISSAITFAYLGEINYIVGFAIIIGMMIGAQLGSLTGKKIKSHYLRKLAAIMIIIIAIQMIVFAIIGKPT